MSNTDDPGSGTGRRGRGAAGTTGTTGTTGSRTTRGGAAGARSGARGAAAGASGGLTGATGATTGTTGATTPLPPTGAAGTSGTTGSSGTTATSGTTSGASSTSSGGGAGLSGVGGGTGSSTSSATTSSVRSAAPPAGFAAPTGMGTLTSLAGGHFHYSLISWGSVFAGAVIAIVVGAMLNLLGLAVGVTATDPGGDGAGPGALTVFGGLWIAVSTIIGLIVGGWVAARSAANPDHHDGALHGAAVWAVSFLLALFLTGSFVSGTAMTAVQAAGNAAEAVRNPGAIADNARDAADRARATPATDTPAERRVEQTAEAARRATVGAAFWAFITMLASLVAAMIGGGFGARGDHGHRPRRTYNDVI